MFAGRVLVYPTPPCVMARTASSDFLCVTVWACDILHQSSNGWLTYAQTTEHVYERDREKSLEFLSELYLYLGLIM